MGDMNLFEGVARFDFPDTPEDDLVITPDLSSIEHFLLPDHEDQVKQDTDPQCSQVAVVPTGLPDQTTHVSPYGLSSALRGLPQETCEVLFRYADAVQKLNQVVVQNQAVNSFKISELERQNLRLQQEVETLKDRVKEAKSSVMTLGALSEKDAPLILAMFRTYNEVTGYFTMTAVPFTREIHEELNYPDKFVEGDHLIILDLKTIASVLSRQYSYEDLSSISTRVGAGPNEYCKSGNLGQKLRNWLSFRLLPLLGAYCVVQSKTLLTAMPDISKGLNVHHRTNFGQNTVTWMFFALPMSRAIKVTDWAVKTITETDPESNVRKLAAKMLQSNPMDLEELLWCPDVSKEALDGTPKESHASLMKVANKVLSSPTPSLKELKTSKNHIQENINGLCPIEHFPRVITEEEYHRLSMALSEKELAKTLPEENFIREHQVRNLPYFVHTYQSGEQMTRLVADPRRAALLTKFFGWTLEECISHLLGDLHSTVPTLWTRFTHSKELINPANHPVYVELRAGRMMTLLRGDDAKTKKINAIEAGLTNALARTHSIMETGGDTRAASKRRDKAVNKAIRAKNALDDIGVLKPMIPQTEAKKRKNVPETKKPDIKGKSRKESDSDSEPEIKKEKSSHRPSLYLDPTKPRFTPRSAPRLDEQECQSTSVYFRRPYNFVSTPLSNQQK